MAIPAARDFLRRLQALVEAGEPCVVATVTHVEGSTSARPGDKMIIDAQVRPLYVWVGCGCAETTVADEARLALAERRPRTLRLDLDDEVLGVGMPCGGFMDLYLEPVLARTRLLVLGHGLIAETLAAMAHRLEFEVGVNDALASPDRFPDADERVTEDPDYAKVHCDSETFVVITTQHKSDYEALVSVLRQEPAYVGLVASRKRSALLFERLLEDGFTTDQLRRVSAPCGLDLGSETPQEIALSILAEILRHSRGGRGTGQPLRELRGVAITEQGIEIPEGPGNPDKCPS